MACAAALAGAGAEVFLAARRLARVEEIAGRIAESGGAARAGAMDITDVEATARLVEAEGPFGILVNSAGLAIHSHATETRAGDFDRVMAVNARGAYFLAQAVARGLVGARLPGSIITISSQMGAVGGQERAVYCASKHAVEGFTKAMAIDLAPKGIRVNTVCPTFIRTPLTEGTFQDPEKVRWIEEKIKLGRTGRVEDVTGAVVYLASEASSLVTGTALMVDGGWTAD